MKQLQSFHHYSTAHEQARLPIEALEEEVVAMLLTSPVKDEQRDSSICFELKHSSAVTQFARLLAHKRGLHVDVCAAGALLHDIYVVTSGSYTDHAHRGVPVARSMVERVGGFSPAQVGAIERIVGHHSDKHIFSSDPFAEFGKDVDVLDAFLYPGAFDWYLGNKPLTVFRHYLSRAAAVWEDLGLTPDPRFALLADCEEDWLTARCPVPSPTGGDPDTLPTPWRDIPPCLVERDGKEWLANFSEVAWTQAAMKLGLADAKAAIRSVVPTLAPASVEDPGVLGYVIWPLLERYEILDSTGVGCSRLAELRGPVATSMQTGN